MENEKLKKAVKKEVEYSSLTGRRCPAARRMRAGFLAFAYSRSGKKECLQALSELGYISRTPTESETEAYFNHLLEYNCYRDRIEVAWKNRDGPDGHHITISQLERVRNEESGFMDSLIQRLQYS